MVESVLIANRGEIAVRIARSCHELGVRVIAVHSEVDAGARYVRMAHDVIPLAGVAPRDTYLNIPAILDAAARSGAEAIHPGYGFLAERAKFARAVIDNGRIWIGPPPDVVAAVGDKIEARRIALDAGVPVVPGLAEPTNDPREIASFAERYGYPLAVKAAGGGGGRGLKVVHDDGEIHEAFASARREAEAYFGNPEVYVEKYLEAPKHIEVQLLAPNRDEALWLGLRDCSLQRRHQKLVEETPPPLHAELASEMGQATVALSKACGYVGAGTAEFLVDPDGRFYFLELNARLQVEHTVTEEVLGLDLVACQLRIAAGEPLGFTQDDLDPRGHAIECRINAEDAARGFLPTPGRLSRYVEPDGFGVRVDSGFEAGDVIPEAYDSLIAKVITWGNDRDEARRRMLRALAEMTVEGVSSTIPVHLLLLEEESFRAGTHTTRTIEGDGVLDELVAAERADGAPEEDVLLVGGRPVRLWNPAMAGSAAAAVHGVGASTGEVVAPMQGTILKVLVEAGQKVDHQQPLMVLEAMKMETVITAPRSGSVAHLRVSPGQTVGASEVVAVVE